MGGGSLQKVAPCSQQDGGWERPCQALVAPASFAAEGVAGGDCRMLCGRQEGRGDGHQVSRTAACTPACRSAPVTLRCTGGGRGEDRVAAAAALGGRGAGGHARRHGMPTGVLTQTTWLQNWSPP